MFSIPSGILMVPAVSQLFETKKMYHYFGSYIKTNIYVYNITSTQKVLDSHALNSFRQDC